jgi:hypothetical protein
MTRPVTLIAWDVTSPAILVGVSALLYFWPTTVTRADRYRLRAFVVALGRYQYEIRFVALTADGSAKPTRDAALPVLTIRLTIRIVGIEKAQ